MGVQACKVCYAYLTKEAVKRNLSADNKGLFCLNFYRAVMGTESSIYFSSMRTNAK